MAKSERNASSLTKKLIRLLIGIIGIILQGVLFYLIFFSLPKYRPIYLTMQALALLTVFGIYRGNGNSSYKLSWTIVILALPFGGVIFYFAYGKGRSLPHRKNKKIQAYLKDKIETNEVKEELKDIDLRYYKMANVLYNNAHLPFYKNTYTTFYPDGEIKFQALLEELKKAEKYIFLEYFIIKEGEMWEAIKSILVEKACEGVIVKILYDDVGSRKSLVIPAVKLLNNIPNIEMCAYNPLGKNLSLSINYRDHRKIAIIDGKSCICGGVNIGDEYIHRKERFGFWRDNALKIEGEAVKNFILLFAENWYISTKQMLDVKEFTPEYEKNDAKGYVCAFGDGPSIETNPAYNLFQSMFDNAQKYIYISTPYLIIDQEFINTIVMACQSGVDVRILVPHIPDKKTVFMMTKAHYGDILKAGGKIYEYEPGFNHAKNIICDDKFAFIGTVNIDYRSLFLHYECGNFLLETDSIIDMKKDFIEALKVSKEITIEDWNNRNILIKIMEVILAVTSPLM